MSTAQLVQPRTGPIASPTEGRAGRLSRAPLTLGLGLLVTVLYAAFSHGATSSPDEARLQVAIAAIAALAAAAWLFSGTLRITAPRLAYAGIGLLAAFAVWSGVSLLWSVDPDGTWVELNRAITYVIVLILAVALGASHVRCGELVAKGFLAVAVAVTCYALGQKLLPGLHLAGVFNLNQTGPVPRLQEPFGYWNALALFIVMAVPIALGLLVDRSRSRRTRLAALVALEPMLLVIALTYSRGGVVALVLGLGFGIALSRARLRSLMWLALAVVATTPSLVFALVDHRLTAANVALGRRETAGLLLLAILVVSCLAVAWAGVKLIGLEQRGRVSAQGARRTGTALASLVVVLLVAGVLVITFSSRGLGGTLSHEWKSFTATRATSVYEPNRLLSADSANRWVWWKEAAGAFSARPLLGWGAGSFPVVHLLYRRDTLSVKQPHSVPLQWLAETGLIGALLATAGFALLIGVGVQSVRQAEVPRERLLAAGLLAGAVAYAVHALYDWDWDIPGVTLPALIFLGVLAGSLGRRREPSQFHVPGPGLGLRAIGVVAATLYLCSFALSAALPSIASSKASSAIVIAGSGSPGALQRAQETAALATSLDPLSDYGLRTEATIAQRGGQLRRARSDLLAAVRRDPSDVQAWISLAYAEISLGNVRDARRAAARVLALDPKSPLAGSFASGVSAGTIVPITPPKDSATASPLPKG